MSIEILSVLGLLIIIWIIWTYNRMIKLKNQVAAAWSDIDVQLQRRFDLVPNLIKVVKGYCEHERKTLTAVAQRWSSQEQANPRRVAQENQLSQAMGKLIAVAEDYPQLWSSEQFQTLHRTLVEVEDYLQYARRYYNGSVRDFNTRLNHFPDVLVSRWFRFEDAEFFEVESALQRQSPAVAIS